jgi:translation elongation factor P/translation initiation factor 5A
MYVYLISNDFIGFKIGRSKHPKKRIKELQTGNADQLKLIKTYKSPKHHKKLEFALHNIYEYKNKLGEWYLLDDNDINQFEVICKQIEDSFIYLEENKI